MEAAGLDEHACSANRQLITNRWQQRLSINEEDVWCKEARLGRAGLDRRRAKTIT